jgi:kinesin family protein 4/21/27
MSLEKEIMRLQEVLREREAEISVLEKSLNVPTIVPPTISEEDHEPQSNGTSAEIYPDINVFLSPKTINRFDNLRKVMENGHGHPDYGSDKAVSEADESLDRLNEVML